MTKGKKKNPKIAYFKDLCIPIRQVHDPILKITTQVQGSESGYYTKLWNHETNASSKYLTDTHTHTHTHTNTHAHKTTHARKHTQYVCVCVCVCACVCVCMYMYVYVCIYIYMLKIFNISLLQREREYL